MSDPLLDDSWSRWVGVHLGWSLIVLGWVVGVGFEGSMRDGWMIGCGLAKEGYLIWGWDGRGKGRDRTAGRVWKEGEWKNERIMNGSR